MIMLAAGAMSLVALAKGVEQISIVENEIATINVPFGITSYLPSNMDVVRIGSALFAYPKVEAGQAVVKAAASRDAQKTDFLELFKDATVLYSDKLMDIKSRIHTVILSRLNAGENSLSNTEDKDLVFRAEQCLDQVMREFRHDFPDEIDIKAVRQSLVDELLGLGPLSPMIRTPEITEIMVNGPDRVFVECRGRIYETGVRFFNERHLIQIIQRIVEPLGRHIDDASQMVDARLADGSRVNVIIPSLALDGASMTIRKFAEKKLTTEDLIRFGSMTKDMALFRGADRGHWPSARSFCLARPALSPAPDVCGHSRGGCVRHSFLGGHRTCDRLVTGAGTFRRRWFVRAAFVLSDEGEAPARPV